VHEPREPATSQGSAWEVAQPGANGRDTRGRAVRSSKRDQETHRRFTNQGRRRLSSASTHQDEGGWRNPARRDRYGGGGCQDVSDPTIDRGSKDRAKSVESRRRHQVCLFRARGEVMERGRSDGRQRTARSLRQGSRWKPSTEGGILPGRGGGGGAVDSVGNSGLICRFIPGRSSRWLRRLGLDARLAGTHSSMQDLDGLIDQEVGENEVAIATSAAFGDQRVGRGGA